MGKQVNQFLKEWNEAKNDEQKRRDLAEDIWYDWFCSPLSLTTTKYLLGRPPEAEPSVSASTRGRARASSIPTVISHG